MKSNLRYISKLTVQIFEEAYLPPFFCLYTFSVLRFGWIRFFPGGSDPDSLLIFHHPVLLSSRIRFFPYGRIRIHYSIFTLLYFYQVGFGSGFSVWSDPDSLFNIHHPLLLSSRIRIRFFFWKFGSGSSTLSQRD